MLWYIDMPLCVEAYLFTGGLYKAHAVPHTVLLISFKV